MMKQIAIATLFVALATPAHALEYDCSPLTGACTPRASPLSVFDGSSPIVFVQPWPRTCPLDGPGAWSCNRKQEQRKWK